MDEEAAGGLELIGCVVAAAGVLEAAVGGEGHGADELGGAVAQDAEEGDDTLVTVVENFDARWRFG
jgi:hypothetical protein